MYIHLADNVNNFGGLFDGSTFADTRSHVKDIVVLDLLQVTWHYCCFQNCNYLVLDHHLFINVEYVINILYQIG